MLKKHIVLFESKDYGWIAYSTTGSDSKRILSVNNKYNIFYIFECDLLKQYPYIMKLKAPLNKHYDCKRINKYKEEIFLEKDESIIVSSKPDGQDEGIYFDIKYN
jgi:hypothetical protein